MTERTPRDNPQSESGAADLYDSMLVPLSNAFGTLVKAVVRRFA